MKLQNLAKLALGSCVTLAALGSVQIPQASATLLTSYQFNGKGNWSLDAVGGNNTPIGDINAFVPVGSKVEKAFLYSTKIAEITASPQIPTVNFDGTIYSGNDWTDLGATGAPGYLNAFRTDVTSQVAAKVGNGSANNFIFSILSETVNPDIDGEALAIVYSNPNELERTIAFLDGKTNTSADTTSVNLANALTATQLTDPNFEALLSLGIGYSYQAGGRQQYSTVNVNGSRLTSAAGGEDDGDGVTVNGGLITIGGIDDSINNPANPFATPTNAQSDDELYSLKTFLAAGNTQIKIDTTNPSGDDNIFFAGINITAQAGVNAPPPATSVPEPFTVIGTMLGGAAAFRMRKRLKSTNKL